MEVILVIFSQKSVTNTAEWGSGANPTRFPLKHCLRSLGLQGPEKTDLQKPAKNEKTGLQRLQKNDLKGPVKNRLQGSGKTGLLRLQKNDLQGPMKNRLQGSGNWVTKAWDDWMRTREDWVTWGLGRLDEDQRRLGYMRPGKTE